MYNEIKNQALTLFKELVETANLKKGSLVVLGCSTSEIMGSKIGTNSQFDCAQALYSGFYPYLKEQGIFLAAQCCEHLNRAIIIEAELAERLNLQQVNVVPQPKAGGSFATAAYHSFRDPVALEHIRADAGLDIGGTLIGMHLKDVAVPVRIRTTEIGDGHVVCARTRPKFIGGGRAVYDEELM